VIGSTSFIAEDATAWLLCEAIVTVVELSSPEVGANVIHLFSNAIDQEQGNMSHPGFRGPKPGSEHNHQVCWDQVSHI
jgi:hypothetical protein